MINGVNGMTGGAVAVLMCYVTEQVLPHGMPGWHAFWE